MNADSPPPPATPWHRHWLSPLNLAAYITWLAVALQSVRWGKLVDGDTLQGRGLGALLLVLAAYLLLAATPRRRADAQRLERALVLVQALGTLAATWYLRNGGPAILLIIVAGQMVSLWPTRQAVILMLICNAALAGLWSYGVHWADIALSLLPMIGFQAFAGLTIHYATHAERAREDLAHTHAELLATQRLLEDSARSGERLRLSRELHDVAGHKLTALKLNLRLLQRDPALAGREEVTVAATLADELLTDIRAVVSELRRYDGIDLPAAIDTLTRQIPGTRFVVRIDPQLRVAEVQAAEILLRCAQEGITNALRHGRASEIQIDCARVGERLELRIRNDGAPLRTPQFGNGLTGMRERLSAAGGELRLQAGPQGGAELIAALPVSA
jgi:signal transduction histidine kinase